MSVMKTPSPQLVPLRLKIDNDIASTEQVGGETPPTPSHLQKSLNSRFFSKNVGTNFGWEKIIAPGEKNKYLYKFTRLYGKKHRHNTDRSWSIDTPLEKKNAWNAKWLSFWSKDWFSASNRSAARVLFTTRYLWPTQGTPLASLAHWHHMDSHGTFADLTLSDLSAFQISWILHPVAPKCLVPIFMIFFPCLVNYLKIIGRNLTLNVTEKLYGKLTEILL